MTKPNLTMKVMRAYVESTQNVSLTAAFKHFKGLSTEAKQHPKRFNNRIERLWEEVMLFDQPDTAASLDEALMYDGQAHDYEITAKDLCEAVDTLEAADVPDIEPDMEELLDDVFPADTGEEVEAEPVIGGSMDSPLERRDIGPRGRRTYVFTCAQNNTRMIPDAWWDNLMTLVDHYKADLHISQFTYNKAAYGSKSVKPGSKKASDDADLWFDPRMDPYISNDDIQITEDLVWNGSLNLIPTLINPITGFQSINRGASAIIPHAKIAMQSVATMKYDPARFIYTTGCITQRNYIMKSAGQKADFHHVFGALIVEVDENGKWWVRQLNFDRFGVLYDLNKKFDKGVEIIRPEALTHGDIHGAKADDEIMGSVFGEGGMLDVLFPRKQFFHDIIDFMPRNHHNLKDFQFLKDQYWSGTDLVEKEFKDMSLLLMSADGAYRDWCDSYVVVSNHDQALNVWLKNVDALKDPVNMELWLRLNHKRALQSSKYHPFIDLMSTHCTNRLTADTRLPVFLPEDSGMKICGDIEVSVHGHLGPNGARGAPGNIKLVGKANTGHTHSAGILEGVYTSGLLARLDMGYNVGQSSWSHSSILTQPNGKRAILTHNGVGWWRKD